MPTPQPLLPGSLSAIGPEPSPSEAPSRPRLRIAAMAGALSCFAWCVAFFLPWIVFPPAERVRIRDALAPDIEALPPGQSAHAERYRILLGTILDDGGLSGLDLFHYARSALALNEELLGPQPPEVRTERPWVIRRMFRGAAWVLAALPILSLLLGLHFTLHGLRRARAPVLILATVLGCAGGAIAISWLTFSESLAAGARTGFGLRAVLAASVAQACVGLFGVTSRNWWIVYLGVAITLLGLGSIARSYVGHGALP